jgi:hypothetical protein
MKGMKTMDDADDFGGSALIVEDTPFVGDSFFFNPCNS